MEIEFTIASAGFIKYGSTKYFPRIKKRAPVKYIMLISMEVVRIL
jgi:hypothetical protein